MKATFDIGVFNMNQVVTKEETIEQKVRALPSASQEAFAEIIQGLYAGKPLMGQGGLLTQLVKDLTQVGVASENGL